MKKIGSFLLALLFVTGCACGNTKLTQTTPTKEVEAFFNNYQTLNNDVLTQLDDVVNNQEDFNDEQRDQYKELMKKHYKDLSYEIKDEKIDGDTATVTVEIEVTDYSKIMTDADAYLEANKDKFNNEEGIYDATLFTKYRLEQLKEANEKVKYTLDLTLTKINDDWVMDTLSDTDESKIQGMYIY